MSGADGPKGRDPAQASKIRPTEKSGADQLDRVPVDSVQYQAWEAAGIRENDVARRLELMEFDLGYSRGLGIEL